MLILRVLLRKIGVGASIQILRATRKKIHLTKEELEEIIERLAADNPGDEAFFGILQYGGGADESYIHANKAGLELFAAELLKASKGIGDPDKEDIYVLELDEDIWLDGDTIIDYIETSKRGRSESPKVNHDYSETWIDRLIPFGCISLVVIGFILMIIGMIAIVQWIIT